MTVEYRKVDGRWDWKLHCGAGVLFGATGGFRFKMSARRDFKKRFISLKRKRSHWPEFKEVEARTK